MNEQAKGGKLYPTDNPGTSSPQRNIQQIPPKDCANLHNIFRRGLNLLPRVDF